MCDLIEWADWTLIGQVNLTEEYDILQTVGEGWFAKVLLAEHRRTRAEVVLKAVSKDTTSRREFFREFHYSYYLSPHPAVSKTYDCAFESERYFFFAQEFAPFGDLTSNVGDRGLGEVYTKRVAAQIASALDFMHSKELVHRDLKVKTPAADWIRRNRNTWVTRFSVAGRHAIGSNLVATLLTRLGMKLSYGGTCRSYGGTCCGTCDGTYGGTW